MPILQKKKKKKWTLGIQTISEEVGGSGISTIFVEHKCKKDRHSKVNDETETDMFRSFESYLYLFE